LFVEHSLQQLRDLVNLVDILQTSLIALAPLMRYAPLRR